MVYSSPQNNANYPDSAEWEIEATDVKYHYLGTKSVADCFRVLHINKGAGYGDVQPTPVHQGSFEDGRFLSTDGAV